MSVKQLLRGIIGLTALCLITTAGYGGDFRLFALAGGSSFFNSHTFTVDSDSWRSNYANGGKIIVGGEMPLNKVLGLEAAYSFGRNNLRLTGADGTTGFGVYGGRLNTNFVLHAPRALFHLRPYVTAGIEYSRFSPGSGTDTVVTASGFTGSDAVTLKADNKFGFNYGAGIEWNLLRHLGLRFDVRDHVTGSPRFGLSTDSGVTGAFPVSGAAQGVEYAAGVVLHFGK
jgi:opacity protein-like surface antigen